jgi:hypothetical protein
MSTACLFGWHFRYRMSHANVNNTSMKECLKNGACGWMGSDALMNGQLEYIIGRSVSGVGASFIAKNERTCHWSLYERSLAHSCRSSPPRNRIEQPIWTLAPWQGKRT